MAAEVKHDEWMSGGSLVEVDTDCEGLTEERCCEIHDDTVRIFKQIFPPN